jgi:hypothetical protein
MAENEDVLLPCARAGSWYGLWRATKWWAGIAFLGLVVSAVGWVNLLAVAARGEPIGPSARPYEWFFTATGGLVCVLTLTMEAGPWLTARRGRPVRLTSFGVTYFRRVTMPWSMFHEFDVLVDESGRRELVGLFVSGASVSARLGAYRIAEDALSLGDVDERLDVLDAVRRWREASA